MKTGESRLALMRVKIPRQEIEAAWSMIGFLSCSAPNSLSSEKHRGHLHRLLSKINYISRCSALHGSQLPPPKLQIDTCTKEMEWVYSLLSSKILAVESSTDEFIQEVIPRAVMLEEFDEVLNLLQTTLPATTKEVIKLWKYSCMTGSSLGVEADIQPDIINLDTDKSRNACSLMPSTALLQRCTSLAATYANMAMAKTNRWDCFRKILLKSVKDFEKEATGLEEKASGTSNTTDAFTAMFQSIEKATEIATVESPVSAHKREAGCYLMIAVVIARSSYDIRGNDMMFRLNKSFRELVSVCIMYQICYLEGVCSRYLFA